MRVLLLEDDTVVRSHVATALRSQGYAVDETDSLAGADERTFITEYSAAVFDRFVSDGDSMDLVKTMRSRGDHTAVIFLTAAVELDERIAGLDSGGDDYLTKPFALGELLARVRAIARRPPTTEAPLLEYQDLQVDTVSFRAVRHGRQLNLTPKEFAILHFLTRHAGDVVSRSDLVEHCWDEFADPRSNIVDVRVGLLRQKLGDPPILHTVRGIGYTIR
ncbi:response regulator transcription factor [Plantibacter sp. VKM Ac-2885]|uniref:response regulator transcription factor n=1 Tax=Plantibacter sp. VKM Ac-2885 TaxID=2783828 RepID=UPI00188B10AA|nr:response regulator transcription factor [Plantibacter sp. VKM Ac-2885]MBF4514113.1 response regulator transcription factor [Plantibacter sp. VKM Ac-2885]